jgi:hypothetical protein
MFDQFHQISEVKWQSATCKISRDFLVFQSMKIEFEIFNREFFRTLTFSLKFQKKAQVSIIYETNYFSTSVRSSQGGAV